MASDDFSDFPRQSDGACGITEPVVFALKGLKSLPKMSPPPPPSTSILSHHSTFAVLLRGPASVLVGFAFCLPARLLLQIKTPLLSSASAAHVQNQFVRYLDCHRNCKWKGCLILPHVRDLSHELELIPRSLLLVSGATSDHCLGCREEEAAFSRTLLKGIALFKKFTSNLQGTKTLSGEDAFQLYDTYGFPLDLTEVRSSFLKICNSSDH